MCHKHIPLNRRTAAAQAALLDMHFVRDALAERVRAALASGATGVCRCRAEPACPAAVDAKAWCCAATK